MSKDQILSENFHNTIEGIILMRKSIFTNVSGMLGLFRQTSFILSDD